MLPISALLNDEVANADANVNTNTQMTDVKAEPSVTEQQLHGSFRHGPRYLMPRTSTISSSSDDIDDDDSAMGDDDGLQSPMQSYRLSDPMHTAETSSLLGALTLQRMRSAPTPTRSGKAAASASVSASPSASGAAAASASAQSSHRPYLSVAGMTNPMESSSPRANSDVSPGGKSKSGRRRSTRSLFPGATDDQRRAKQRMIVKRCYYKKINTINELREQVEQLEHTFHGLLDEHGAERNSEGAEEGLSMRGQYMETVEEKEALRCENQRLRKLADEYYMKNQGRLRVVLDANRKEMILFTPSTSD